MWWLVAGVLVGPCCLEAGVRLTRTSSLFTWSYRYWSLRGRSQSWSPALLLRNNLHSAHSLSLSVYLIEGDKTEEDINQMVTWDLSLDVLGRDYLFQFLPGSRQAVGGKNICLKFPHINLGSTAAKIRTEWNLFIPVKHPISRAQINKVGNLQLFILTERRWLDTIISYWPSRYWHPTT